MDTEQYNRPSEEITRRTETQLGRDLIDEILPPDNPRVRYIAAAIAIVVGIVSFFWIASWAGDPETYAATIASLDEKRDTVMRLVAGSTGTSAAITLLPGDVGTPIAEKLLDLGSDFAIVIGAIYLEKYLLTILGLAAFKILIPGGCLIFAIAMLFNNARTTRYAFAQFAARLALFGVAIFLVVPVSVRVSNVIETAYESSMSETIDAFEESSGTSEATTDEVLDQESRNALDSLGDLITGIPENLSNVASGVSESVQSALNRFIETLAVMIVTSCVIPILVLIFFMWLAKAILGVQFDMPSVAPRAVRKRR